MGSFITFDLNSLKNLLENCHNCATGQSPQVTTEEDSSKRLGSDVARLFHFLCCDTVVNTQGAIFWHSDELSPDAITAREGESEDKREHEKQSVDAGQFEAIIVKCEEDVTRLDDEDVGGSKQMQEDPLSLDKVVNQNSLPIKTYDTGQPSGSLSNSELRKQLLGILSVQDLIGANESESSLTGKLTKQKYPESFTCEYCGKVFSGKERAYQFYYHRNKEHTREILYSCNICMKEFWGDRELLAHMANHKNPLQICHVCGNKFSDKRNLKKHLLIHQPTKDYRCSFCDKTFRRRDHRQVHERIHTGVRPYQCTWCDSAFPQKRQLTLHHGKCPFRKRQESKLS